MRPLDQLPKTAAAGIRVVFTDIDDTLTSRGKLESEAFAALWRMRALGISVVPVTGRPAGWCDAIVRQWPVDAVIGENGAFVFFERGGVLKARFHPAAVGSEDTDAYPSPGTVETIRARLVPVRDSVLQAVQGSRVAKDQPYRIFDLAIDYCEDEPRLGLDTAERIRAECERHGCVAKVSSIHVNAWFGAYDKVAMTRFVARDLYDLDDKGLAEHALFVGDSPNDAPMFAAFAHSVGVANVRRFLPQLEHQPTYVTGQPGGAGFAEISRVLLAARSVC